ncbi:MAG: nucleotide-binding protein [Proteobacteria bacterium]|nr:nucleotide-binding protein [Pseudomonadota bacterium]
MAALVLLGCAVLVGIVRLTFRAHHSEAVVLRPGTIAAQDAAAHIGQAITVEGIVSEVHVSTRVTFIDVGGRYPNEKFTGVIFSDDYGAFPEVTKLQGRTIDISGTIRLYGARPEIVLKSANQIRRR